MSNAKNTNRNGAVLYDGPSMIDGSPIVVIATGLGRSSENEKTGDLVQTWIMPRDVPPAEAVRSGADASVCGDCPHRPVHYRERGHARCYVSAWKLRSVWDCFHRGGYGRPSDASWAKGRTVRFGSWGDPGAVPDSVWAPIRAAADGWTGYTHNPEALEDAPAWLMASCDSPEEASDLAEAGIRYFRVGSVGEQPSSNEMLCPASAEAKAKRPDRPAVQCADCGACNGTRPNDKRRSVFIPNHDPAANAQKRKRASLPVLTNV